MLLFLDLCLELEGSYVWRKRRNWAKNKVEQNAAYCHGVDNVFLDVSAACPCRRCGLAQSAFITCEVWLSLSHIAFLIFCSVLYLIFCSCWSQQQQEKQAPLSITHRARSICIADVRGRSSSFAPACPSVWPRSVCSCHSPEVMEDAESCRDCSTKYLCGNRAWTKSTLCLPLWKSFKGREGGISAPRATALPVTGLATCRSWADLRLLMGAMRRSPIISDELQTRHETTPISQDLEESFFWTGHSLLAHFQAVSTWP